MCNNVHKFRYYTILESSVHHMKVQRTLEHRLKGKPTKFTNTQKKARSIFFTVSFFRLFHSFSEFSGYFIPFHIFFCLRCAIRSMVEFWVGWTCARCSKLHYSTKNTNKKISSISFFRTRCSQINFMLAFFLIIFEVFNGTRDYITYYLI